MVNILNIFEIISIVICRYKNYSAVTIFNIITEIHFAFDYISDHGYYKLIIIIVYVCLVITNSGGNINMYLLS